MQVKEYLKGVATRLLAPVIKSMGNYNPNIPVGFQMMGINTFPTGINNYGAYYNKIFYTAQNILVRKFTEAPITVNRKKVVNKRLNKFYSKSISNEERAFIKTQNLQELEDHELNILFDKPNTYQSGIEMMEDFWYNYGFGDGFLLFESLGELSRDKRPIAIHSLMRNRMMINKSNEEFDAVLSYTYTTNNGKQIVIPKENILHLKHWNPNLSDLKGLGVDQVSAIDINLNNHNNLAQGAAFVNGGRGTLFSSDSVVSQDGTIVEKYSATQMDVLKESMRKDFQGSHNNRRMYFANGMVNATSYGDTFAEMELISAESNNWKSIFITSGVPIVLGPITEGSTESNVKAGYKALVTNTIINEIKKLDQKLTQKIQQWWSDIIIIHDLTEFTELAPDLKLMMEVYGKPTLSEDERRSVFGYEEMPDKIGQNYLVASGLMKIQDIIVDPFANMPPTPPAL